MTAWRTHLSCVVVDAESGIFKILVRQEDILGLGKDLNHLCGALKINARRSP